MEKQWIAKEYPVTDGWPGTGQINSRQAAILGLEVNIRTTAS